MDKTTFTVPMSKVSGGYVCEVRVTGLKWWMIRMCLAVWLITLAGYIAPIRFDIDIRG